MGISGLYDIGADRTKACSIDGSSVIKRGNEMIKTGDKGTVDGRPARVIADDLKGEYPLAIAHLHGNDEHVRRYGEDGVYGSGIPFIPSKPWDSLKPEDACFVRDSPDRKWRARVFAGVASGNPTTFTIDENVTWEYCVPAKLIDGELIPVEDE